MITLLVTILHLILALSGFVWFFPFFFLTNYLHTVYNAINNFAQLYTNLEFYNLYNYTLSIYTRSNNFKQLHNSKSPYST